MNTVVYLFTSEIHGYAIGVSKDPARLLRQLRQQFTDPSLKSMGYWTCPDPRQMLAELLEAVKGVRFVSDPDNAWLYLEGRWVGWLFQEAQNRQGVWHFDPGRPIEPDLALALLKDRIKRGCTEPYAAALEFEVNLEPEDKQKYLALAKEWWEEYYHWNPRRPAPPTHW